MRVVVVGDLAFKGRYHLGDEAMSEVALLELRKRGAEVTFIAGDPEVTSDFYGVDAVPRFGFGSVRERAAKDAHLDEIVSAIQNGSEPPQGTADTIGALRAADAVVIAGGGNLNSIGIHHIYERLTVKRIAEYLEIPLFVTSQTVGPHLRDSERVLVSEIAQYATVFGVRERNSAALMRALCGDNARIVHTLDDAILLPPAESGSPIELPKRYVVASFTFHARTTGMHEDDYYRELAAILDRIVEAHDVEVLLLPHMSTFERPNPLGVEDDQYGHDRISLFSRSGRVTSVPLMTARELLSVTSSAVFSLSTRYHPLIFGAALGIPAVSLVTSYYSAIRMRGALDNVGMESFALPFEYWTTHFGDAVIMALRERLEEFSEHIREVGDVQRDYQSRWWDGIVSSIAGTGSALLDDRQRVESINWGSDKERGELTTARVAQESLNVDRLNAQLQAEDEKLRDREVTNRLRQLELSAHDLNEKLEREIFEIRHRIRPPGANLRDRVHRKLRGMRGL